MEQTVDVPAVSPAGSERLLRLDSAVRACRLVLADRAAQALTSTGRSAQLGRGDA